MKVIAPKRLMRNLSPIIRNGDIFNQASLDLEFARTRTLDTRVTHTRQSSATYVDGDGVIRTAVTNLLLRSEEFDSVNWSGAGGAVATAGTAIAPNGTATADTLTDTNGTTANPVVFQTVTLADSTTYTISCYLKAGTKSTARVGIRDKASNYILSNFDLTAGTTSVGNAISSSIQPVGSGWYRCIVVANSSTGATSQQGLIYLDTGSYTQDGTGTLLVWGAQLEESSTVGQYVKTTTAINSAPRFDHDPTTGESLGLLVEESRTNLSPYSRYENGQWTFGAASIGTSTKTAVDGETITAFLTDTSTAAHRVNRLLSGAYTAGTVVTFSFYVAKPAGSDIRGIVARIRTAAGGQAVLIEVSDDGEDSVYTFTSSSPFGASAPPAITASDFSAVPVGNKWTRISIVTQVSSINTNYTQWDIGFSSATNSDTGLGTANSELFIDAVQLEAGSFPTSYIPTEGSTVTRAADVTSITGRNFGSVNLVQYSEEFDDSYWTKTGGSIAPNTLTAPNSTFTADKLIEDTSTGSHRIHQQLTTVAGNIIFSVYVKAAERDYLQIRFQEGGSFVSRAEYDLALGTAIPVSGSLPSIANVGDGWYRISLTASSAGSATFQAQVWMADSSSSLSYTGDGTSGLYLWGAQLEEGSTATDYIKSDVNFTSRGSTATYYDVNGVIQTAAVDEARTAAYLPDGNGNFVSAGDLLLEGAGTNLLPYSEEFDNAWWDKTSGSGATGITANSIIAPDGTLTADTLFPDVYTGTDGNQFVRLTDNQQFDENTTYTFSLFAKKGGVDYLKITAVNFNTPRDHYAVNFNLDAGVVDDTDSFGTPTNTSSSITDVGNGWFKCVITFNLPGALGDNSNVEILPVKTSNPTWVIYGRVNDPTLTPADYVYIWGAQLEQSSYATSYIPTSGSTATRAADVSTSAATFGNSWYEQSEGTFFVRTQAQNDSVIIVADDGGFSNRKPQLAVGAASAMETAYVASNSVVASLSNSNTANTVFNGAVVYKVDDYAAVINGGTVISDTAGALPSNCTALRIGAFFNGGNPMDGTLRRLTYWPTRLSDDTLKTITA